MSARKHHSCTVVDCDRPHCAKGLCRFHYQRQLKAKPKPTAVACQKCDQPAVSLGLCSSHYHAQHYASRIATDPEKMAQRSAYHKALRKDPAASAKMNATIRAWRLRKAFGISPEEYAQMSAQQNGACAICRDTDADRRLAVDHCHSTGKVRGLLCKFCNMTLGLMSDSPEKLRAAAAYLDRTAR